ncbi:MAG: DMT family transporter [Pseudomonadota bacterium]
MQTDDPRPSEASGILLAVAAVGLFATMDVLAKGLMQRHDPFMVLWARYASQTFWATIFLAPWLLSLLKTRHLTLQIVRSVCLFSATAMFFTAMSKMELATAVAIFEVGPLMITVLAFLILGEKVGPRRWIGVSAGLVGALVIIRPGTDVFTIWSLLPMGAALGFAGYAIATRFLSNDESHWTSFYYTALFGTVAASVIVPFRWSMPDLGDGALMMSLGVVGGAGHFLLIRAYARTPASAVAPFTYVGLVFAALYGWLFFLEVPDLATIIGASIIIGAGLYVWHRERVAAAAARALEARAEVGR